MTGSPKPEPDAGAVAATKAFLRQVLLDQQREGLRSLEHYVAAFPDQRMTVAREYARLIAPSGTEPETERDQTDGADAPIDRIGRYEVVEELGRGGQATVYRARDPVAHRDVALKVLPATLRFFMGSRERLLREARVTAGLDHEGICSIHDIGEHEGSPWMAMRLVEGEPLSRRLAREQRTGSLPNKDAIMWAVAFIARAAEVLHAAHEAGLVHRDVKPGNLMVTGENTPVVLDFGLALLDSHADEPRLTRTGDIVGTPAYLAPEQLPGSLAVVDRRTDVHALGATLFECVTHGRPFAAATRIELFEVIATREPPDARAIHRAVSRDLATVTGKALDKNPARRYPTATEFAADLRRVLNHEPVRARPLGHGVRLARWSRRHPLTALLLAGIFSALAAGLLVATTTLRSRDDLLRQRDLLVEDYEGLADLSLIARARSEADLLWPAHPRRLPELERWWHRFGNLPERLARHQQALERARRQLEGASALGMSDDPAPTEFMVESLERLVRDLSAFAQPDGAHASVAKRLHDARAIAAVTLVHHAEAWSSTIKALRGGGHDAGLQLRPQVDLIPLGPDPCSGLHEFLHWPTHDPVAPLPRRDAEGRLPIEARTGFVFVLLPGGSFRMGSPDFPDEQPLQSITLAPFFISKYEMTLGQWLRAGGADPSDSDPIQTESRLSKEELARRPVSRVTWDAASHRLRTLGLVLPTEARWEFACRAGTTTPFSSGAKPASLALYDNVADRARGPGLAGAPPEDHDDGWASVAPVGSFRPNAFGLHDLHGNVSEWCKDLFLPYRGTVVDTSTGERFGDGPATRPIRGGSFRSSANDSRSARRQRAGPMGAFRTLGIRPARELDEGTPVVPR